MPKKAFTIEDFSGGLNTEISPRDLEQNHLVACTNADPSSKGRILNTQVFADDDNNFTDTGSTFSSNTGTGLFVFSNDFDISTFTDDTCDTNHTPGSGTEFGDNPKIIRMDSTALLSTGMIVTGTGVVAGSVITQIDSATLFRVDFDTNATNSGRTFTFQHGRQGGDFVVKADSANEELDAIETPSGVVVTDITGTTVSGHNAETSTSPQFYAAEGDLYIGGDHSVRPYSLKWHVQSKMGERVIKNWAGDFQERTPPSLDTDTATDSTMDIAESSGVNVSGDPLGTNDIRWIIKYGADDTGLWNNTSDADDSSGFYMEFGGSFLYKNKAESDITELPTGSDNGKLSSGTVSAMVDNATHINASAQIQAWMTHPPTVTALNTYGARLYTRKNLDKTWYLLAEIDYEKGIRGDGESDWSDWEGDTTNFDKVDVSNAGYQTTTGTIFAPPSLITFETNNGYTTADMVSTVYWKYGVVANGRAYIGNISVGDRTYGDRILKSPVFQYDVFSENNFIDVASNDGDSITALAAYGDMLLEFKEKKLFLINISKELEYMDDVREHAGVKASAAVTKTPFGVAWANTNGAYLYDGEEVTQLTMGKISDSDWKTNVGLIPENIICGYDPFSRQLIVLWNGGGGYLAVANRIAFVDSNPDTITDSSNGLLTSGFQAGGKLTVSGTASNDGDYTIDTVIAETITLIATDTLTGEGAHGSNVFTLESTNRGKAYVFTFDTGTWHEVDDMMPSVIFNCTNMANTSDGKLIIGGGTAVNEISTYGVRSGNSTVDIRTGHLDLGDPGSKKNLLNVKARYKTGHASLNISIISNDDTDDIGEDSDTLGQLSSTNSALNVQEYDASAIANLQGQYWYQVRIHGTASPDFELDEIVLTYRDLGVR